MSLIYYDVSRLLRRFNVTNPTGIDRVDLAYACHFLDSSRYQLVCVYQNKSTFFSLPELQAGALLRTLQARWSDAGASSMLQSFAAGRNAAFVQRKLLEVIKSLHASTAVSPPIDGSLLNFLVAHRSQPSFYVNTSHYGVSNHQAFEKFHIAGRIQLVFYLHDLIPCDYPEYVRPGDSETHLQRILSMVSFADLVVVNSTYTKERLLAFCRFHELPVPKIQTGTIGVEESFLKKAREISPKISEALKLKRYFTSVGTIEPRKNHLLLLHLWRRFAEDGVDVGHLVLVGRRGWQNQNILDLLDRCPSLKGKVLELSGIGDLLMMDIVKGARALLYPSFVEGWGMPLVEAVALGVPVLCSDIAAFRESGQGLVRYLDPLDGRAWSDGIRNLARDDEKRELMLRQLSGFRFPTWQEHFDLVDETFREMGQKGRGRPPSEKRLRRAFLPEPTPTLTQVAVQQALRRARTKIEDRTSASKLRRKLRKLTRNPQAFFQDAKNPKFRLVGSLLRKL